MAFTTVPFTGPIVATPLNFGWCSASPSKAFIIFTGWTGATVGVGTRKLFVQAVYFNGKAAPTFGPACAVANISYTGDLYPNICALADGRLIATVAESVYTFSYFVFDVNDSDQVSFAFKSGAPLMVAMTNASFYGIPLTLLSGNKVLTGFTPGGGALYENNFQIVDVGATGFTLTTAKAGAAYTFSRLAQQLKNPNYYQTQMFRRDRTGKLMAIRGIQGSSYVVSSQSYAPYAYSFTSFDDQGVPQFYADDHGLSFTAPGTNAGFHDDGGVQKARDMLPISPSTLLSLGAVSPVGQGTMASRFNFVKITIGKQENTETNQITATAETPWRDAKPVMFLDVVWLDSEYFFALARVANSINDDTDMPNGFGVTASAARDHLAYIGKYNDTTGSITLADASPITLPTRCYALQPGGSFLHKISNTEIAILSVAQIGTTSVYELNVTVVGA